MVQVQCWWSLKENFCRKHSWGRCIRTLYCFHKTCRNIRTSGTKNPSEMETETSPVSFSKSSINSSHISSLGKATGSPIWYHCTAPFNRDWKGWGDPENSKYYSQLKNRSKRKSCDQSKCIVLLLILGNIMECVLLEHISECVKAVLSGNSHHRCTKCRLCLSSPSMTKWLDYGQQGNSECCLECAE